MVRVIFVVRVIVLVMVRVRDMEKVSESVELGTPPPRN